MYKRKPRGRKAKVPSKKEFEFLYYEMNLTAKELAERYDVALHTIYNLATKYRKMDENL